MEYNSEELRGEWAGENYSGWVIEHSLQVDSVEETSQSASSQHPSIHPATSSPSSTRTSFNNLLSPHSHHLKVIHDICFAILSSFFSFFPCPVSTAWLSVVSTPLVVGVLLRIVIPASGDLRVCQLGQHGQISMTTKITPYTNNQVVAAKPSTRYRPGPT